MSANAIITELEAQHNFLRTRLTQYAVTVEAKDNEIATLNRQIEAQEKIIEELREAADRAPTTIFDDDPSDYPETD